MFQVRSVLALSQAYELYHYLIGAPRRARALVKDYIQPKAGDRILEIGCGPGSIVPYLPEAEYVGFDASPAYIKRAQKRFPKLRFICQRVSQYSLPQQSYFDIALALGIVHHLDDTEAQQLFQIAHDALKPGGKLVTMDGVYTEDQSSTARFFLDRDRGTFIRTEEQYRRLASGAFDNVKSSIRHDLLRIPYTQIFLQCIR
ncbi:MAG TPA: class I SAM-dependent methyltransferase [Terriglobales bacterium]|jgi:cyclopropane fatty-acyl-phospholipid synthase-like methyltransferase|nr:class I SAM-dependent methyltransferase [Terriglobales bacterium]